MNDPSKPYAVRGLVALTVFVVFGCGGNGSSSSDAGGHGSSGGAASSGGTTSGGVDSGGTSGSGSGSTGSSGSGPSSSSSGASASSSSSSGSSGSSSSSSSSSGSSSGGTASSSGGDDGGGGVGHIKNVFVILMENNNWSSIYPNSQAPYINSLITDTTANAQVSYATNYYDNPMMVHPSEPNYVWLEAGNNFGFTTDDDPSSTHLINQPHLATLLNAKGVSWREYAEDITAGSCPIASNGLYAAKHVPFVFFQDIVGNPPSATSANCVPHMRPFSQLATDLSSGDVAAYNFITPNLCDDMHGATSCPSTSEITQGDTWLQTNVPVITASNAYKNGGAIFITWDESEGGEFPIGMIVISPFAKGHAYAGSMKYYHSSTLRTMQEIFGVAPPADAFLNDAANQLDLSDLFATFP